MREGVFVRVHACCLSISVLKRLRDAGSEYVE